MATHPLRSALHEAERLGSYPATLPMEKDPPL